MTSPGAQVSGPGALSKRTDTGGQPIRHMADPRYGEDKAFVEQQKGAPLAESAGVPNGPPPSAMASPGPSMSADGGGASMPPAREVTGFGAPTAFPDQPVTTGSPLGAGPGPLARDSAQPAQLSTALQDYFAADTTGTLQNFAWTLSEMGL